MVELTGNEVASLFVGLLHRSTKFHIDPDPSYPCCRFIKSFMITFIPTESKKKLNFLVFNFVKVQSREAVMLEITLK